MSDTQTTSQPEFNILRIYVKDISFESPRAPAIFTENLQPTINLNIQTNYTKLSDDTFEVVLGVTVNANENDKSVFLVEIKQAGIFSMKHIPEQNIPVVLNVTCPTILFPYLREAVSDLVARGGFQHFYLTPINFEALYINSLQQQQSPKATPEIITTH